MRKMEIRSLKPWNQAFFKMLLLEGSGLQGNIFGPPGQNQPGFFLNALQSRHRMMLNRSLETSINIFLLCLICLFGSCADQASISFELGYIPEGAGPVWVTIKDSADKEGSYILKPADGQKKDIPLQHWQGSTWVFYKQDGMANLDIANLQVRKTKKRFPERVRFDYAETGFTVKVGAKSILTFNTATLMPPAGQPEYYKRSGFIHPLYSPTGEVLTDGFPAGHTHQHGIFMAWVNTTFKGEKVDFWNQHEELGTVRLLEVSDTVSGSVFAQFKAKLEHISLKNGPALEEEWTVTVYNAVDNFLIDFQSVQQTATRDTLFLNQYHYGGFGYRATREWNGADSVHYSNDMQILTSLGDGRDSSNHTRPDWIAGYGKIEGEMVGLAVMGHPSNFRHPQYVRVHPEMPYFCFPPMVDEGFVIAPGDVYTSNYRLLVFSGEPDQELLDSQWKLYQKAPTLMQGERGE